MVDAGATSHIITDIAKFKKFDSSFQAGTHCVELADGSRCKGVAKRRGDAEVWLIDSGGRSFRTTLRGALYIPTYPQDIFSVKAATSSGATVTFSEKKNVLLHRDGTKLCKMCKTNDQCRKSLDLQSWHEILGHCNYADIMTLKNVVDGMETKNEGNKPVSKC